MKKLCIAVMACVLLLSLFSCRNGVTSAETAKGLVEEGKLKEAYEVLYSADKGDTEAKEMLARFIVLPTTVTRATYTMYNGTCTKTFNEHGDIIREVRNETYNGCTNNYTCDTSYTYDADGRILTSASVKKGDSNNETVCEYTYDANGNLTKEYERQTETGSTLSYETVTEYTYDSANHVLKLTVSNNGELWYSQEYTYDESGNKKTETMTDTSAVTTDTYEYDAQGKISVKTTVRKNANGSESTTKVEYTRNEHGDEIKSVTSVFSGVIVGGPMETTYEYTYDDSGRITSKTTHDLARDEKQYRQYVYNDKGDIIKQIVVGIMGDTLVTEHEITYGQNGKIASDIITMNNYNAQTENTKYDTHGNPVSIKSGEYETTYEYSYGESGQILSKTEVALNGTRTLYEYTYNPDGTDAKTVYYRIGADGVTRESETELIYDGKGNLITEKVKGGKTTEKTYDEYNNILSVRVTDADGTVADEKSYEYLYDASGKMTEKNETDKNGTRMTVYTYNQDGQVTSALIYNNNNYLALYGSEYLYDEKGNMTETRVANYTDGVKGKERITTYTYDEYGRRLTQVGSLDAGGVNTTVITSSDYVYFYTPAD